MTHSFRSGAVTRVHTTRAFVAACAAAFVAAVPAVCAQTSTAYEPRGAVELAQLVDGLGMTARVLVVGAHPDDEDTRLIAYLARGRHAETAYLSLTRGDGGQNLIGNELGEALGAIRTEELLAARRIDGGRQYFTRAFDFGFSKTAAETFRHWPRDTVLGDVVRVVRAFRPQVMIAIFSGTPADGHGHHQASGILAREAYDVAGDTVRFPAAQFGPAWTVGKFYRNTSYRGSETATLRYNAGAYDPVLGRSYAELAAISRSQHKSQGQGGLERKGVSIVSMRREATRVNEGTPANAERDLFDGIDTSIARVTAGAPTGSGTDAERARAAFGFLPGVLRGARAAYNPQDHGMLVMMLGRLTHTLRDAGALGLAESRPADTQVGRDYARTLGEMERRALGALATATGLAVEVTVPREVSASGDTVPVTVTIYNRGRSTVRLRGGALFDDEGGRTRASDFRFRGDSILPDSAFTFVQSARIVGASGPWWLARPRRGDLFGVPLDGRSEEEHEPHFASLVGSVDVGDTFAVLGGHPVFRYVDPVRGEVRHPANVAPAVSVTLDRVVQYARANTPLDRVVTVHLRSASTSVRTATVRLELPAGLTADSAARTVTLPGYDARAAVDFRVRGTLRPGRTVLRASAESNGERFTTGYQLVDYEHIRPQRLYRPAETAIEAVDVALPARANVAYVPGVGDNVAPTLADLGLPVTVLDSAALGTGDLSKYTHVVIGPRAYDANPALAADNARLLDWVRRGGTMVVQYGQYEMTRPGIMPYPITLARPAQRVTLEEAPVAVLDPAAGVLAAPNRIGAADWAGWVQERSTYMPQTADPRYRPAIAINDPGEAPNPNGILVAPVGRGTYVYVTLALFRQLPAGVPGAARLMANLLAARAGAVSAEAGRPAAGR